MASVLAWLGDRDLYPAIIWLFLSGTTVPGLLALGWKRFDIQNRPWIVAIAAVATLATIYSCYVAADLLGRISCQRITHEACLNED